MTPDPIDFSSFARADEQRFVPFELAMRDNARRAWLIGVSVAGAILVVLLGIAFGLYSPCHQFCVKPPNSCHTEAQMAEWRATCDSSCSALVHSNGVEYVQTLNACVFSNGTGSVCSDVVKTATEHRLWCD